MARPGNLSAGSWSFRCQLLIFCLHVPYSSLIAGHGAPLIRHEANWCSKPTEYSVTNFQDAAMSHQGVSESWNCHKGVGGTLQLWAAVVQSSAVSTKTVCCRSIQKYESVVPRIQTEAIPVALVCPTCATESAFCGEHAAVCASLDEHKPSHSWILTGQSQLLLHAAGKETVPSREFWISGYASGDVL